VLVFTDIERVEPMGGLGVCRCRPDPWPLRISHTYLK
jgi:hypothetical protein